MNNEEQIDIAEFGKYTQEEIFQIPECLKRVLEEKDLIKRIANEIQSRKVRSIYLVGAGSSYHAGYAISYMFNNVSKIPTYTEYSMEFEYLIKPILTQDDCIIGISQSGETIDTIEDIKMGKQLGCLSIGISNSLDSSLGNICDFNVPLNCGEEKSILATKTYVAELFVLSMLALEIANIRETITNERYSEIWEELISIPVKISTILPRLHKEIKKYSHYFKFAEFCFILGGGADYASAMEASLKLKEGSRIFGQAYSTAEFPHGPITLADSRAWILAIIPQEEDKIKENILNLLLRIKERKATIFGIYHSDEIPRALDFGVQIPTTIRELQPTLTILVIQLLTLEIARIKGINCDEPKYLKKVSGIYEKDVYKTNL